MPLKEECLQIAFALVLACVNINKRQKATVRIIKYRLNKVVIRIDWTKSLKPLQCSYISFSVLFQTKSSLVWKRYTQKMRRIFQTNSSLVWKEKMEFCKTQIPNQIQIGLEKIDDHCQPHENSKPNLVWFGKIIEFCQRLEP